MKVVRLVMIRGVISARRTLSFSVKIPKIQKPSAFLLRFLFLFFVFFSWMPMPELKFSFDSTDREMYNETEDNYI